MGDTLQHALLHVAESHPKEAIAALFDTPGASGFNYFYFLHQVVGPATNIIIEELARRLDSPDAKIRRAAASGLGQMKARAIQAVPQLHLLLDDNDLSVRDAARVAIRQISG